MNRYRHLPTYRYYPKEGYPLTLEKSVGKDLKNYKIYGNSVQEELFDKDTMQKGFIEQTGVYPTTNSSYPNSTYQIIELKQGQQVNILYSGSNYTYGRIRCIDSETDEVIEGIRATTTDYYTSNANYNSGFVDGTITANKDIKLGILYIMIKPTDFNLSVSYVPSPITPVDIQSVGERTKNLATAKDVYGGGGSEVANQYLETTVDGRECIRFRSSTAFKYTKIPFKENTQYTISFYCKCEKIPSYSSYPTSDRPLFLYYSDGSQLASTIVPDTGWQKITFTSATNRTLESIGMGSFDYRTYMYIDVNTFQIEEGSVATKYEPYGYKIPVKVSGKSLISPKTIYENENSYELTTLDNRDVIKFADNKVVQYSDFKFKENTQYTVQLEAKCVEFKDGVNEAVSCVIAFFYSDGTRSQINIPQNSDWTSYKLTSIKGKTIVGIGTSALNYVNYVYVDINTFMLEEGAEATKYEPYIEPITTNIYLNEPLRKIADFKDYIDFKTAKVVRNIYKQNIKLKSISFTADSWQRTGATSFYSNVLEKVGLTATGSFAKQLSNIFKSGNWQWSLYKEPYNYVLCGHNNGLFYCIIENSYLENITDESTDDEKKTAIKDFFDNNDVYVEYVIAEPTEEDITLPNIPTHKGTTIIEVDTTIEPTLQVQYYK